ncbi:type II toxin-antitoxin system HicB family antitoxin [soil metagenome]
MDTRYAIVVFWSDEDGAWVADAPDLKSCSAFGETAEEALAELQVAIQAWLEVAREKGLPIPEPRFRIHSDTAE